MQTTETDPVLNSPAPVPIHGKQYVFREVSRRQAEAFAAVAQSLARELGKRHNLKLDDLDGDRVAEILLGDLPHIIHEAHGFCDNLIGACSLQWDGKQWVPLQNGALEDPPYSFYLQLATNSILAQREVIDAFTGGLAALRAAFPARKRLAARPKQAPSTKPAPSSDSSGLG